LAGIATGMQHVSTPLLLTVPCDTPSLPAELARHLWMAMQQENAEISVAHDGHFMQPVIALWQCSLYSELLAAVNAGMRKTQDWIRSRRNVQVDFSAQADAFINVNTPDDLSRHG
jgi:molybdopterin-guanine dinucleotide biosynthesis protein A